MLCSLWFHHPVHSQHDLRGQAQTPELTTPPRVEPHYQLLLLLVQWPY